MLSNSEIYPFSLGMSQISVVWSDVLRAEGHSIKHFAPSFVKHLPFCRPKWDPVQHLLCPCVGQNGNLLSSNSFALVPLHLHLRPFKSAHFSLNLGTKNLANIGTQHTRAQEMLDRIPFWPTERQMLDTTWCKML